MAKVTFTKYERKECADGVIAFYAGDVDGVQFSGDSNSVDGLSIAPANLQSVVAKAAAKELSCYPKGIRQPVIAEV